MLIRWREEEGSVLVLTAMLLVALVAASAVAIDLGRIAVSSRDQQGATDRAALDAVLAIASADPIAVGDAALDSLERNLGMSRDGGVSSGRTHTVEAVACGTGESPTPAPWSSADGVEVITESTVRSLFLGTTSSIERRAVACVRSVGAVSAASTTASIDDGLLSELLSALLGGDVSLDLVGYRGVADAMVDLSVLATEAGVGTLDELLSTQMSVADLIDANVAALRADAGNAVALGLADQLEAMKAGLALGLDDIVLGDVLSLDSGAETAGAALAVDGLDLVLAGLQLANKDRAIDLELSVGGDLLPVTLTVIEPPVIAVGRPGRHADGSWRTEATTAQLRLAIGLPIGTADAPATSVLTQDQADRIADYRARITAATSTGQVRAIGDELKAELEQVKQHLEDHGYTTLAAAVGALITGLVSLLASIVAGLLCILTPLACAKTEMRKEVDKYENLLGQINAEAAGTPPPSTRPMLTVTTGEGWARLASVGCGDPRSVGVELQARAAHVGLPPTRLLDLGPLGTITIALDASLGTDASAQLFVLDAPPFPTASERHGGGTVGLGSLLGSIDTSGSQLLLLPVGQVVTLVSSALSPVLDAVDTALLAPVLDVLGADLGVVEGRVLDASCTSRTLIR